MDLNLLAALDALLQEESVTKAATRLGTSAAAVSRKLSSLRRIVGDPLLVRSGQQMALTDRAFELRMEVRALLERTESVLTISTGFDIAGLNRAFTLQASDLLLAAVAAPLIGRIRSRAPEVAVVFMPESMENTSALRQGSVDLELGVLDHLDPETCAEPLARVPMLAAARADHPLFDAPVDARRFAEASHIGISRTGKRHGPIDTALDKLGLCRNVAAVVPSHASAMMLARTTDLVCLTIASGDLPDGVTALGLRAFPIPSTFHRSRSVWPGILGTTPTPPTDGSATKSERPSQGRHDIGRIDHGCCRRSSGSRSGAAEDHVRRTPVR